MKTRHLCLAGLILAAMAGQAQAGGVLAISGVGAVGNGSGGTVDLTLGGEFTASSDFIVSEPGFFDDHQNGLSGAHQESDL